MLEILAVGYLFIKMGKMLRARGWERTIWMQLLVLGVWIAGFLFGGFGIFLYSLGYSLRFGVDAPPPSFSAYLFILLCEACGLGILFYSVHRLPLVPLPPPLPGEEGPPPAAQAPPGDPY